MLNASYQIVQVRYEVGSLIEDTWPVLFAMEAQAIADFNPARMFENQASDCDYFIRELNADFVATGKTTKLDA